MKKFEYVLLLDDVVMDAGQFDATNEYQAEQYLKTEIMPHFACDRYYIGEVKENV